MHKKGSCGDLPLFLLHNSVIRFVLILKLIYHFFPTMTGSNLLGCGFGINAVLC